MDILYIILKNLNNEKTILIFFKMNKILIFFLILDSFSIDELKNSKVKS